LKKVITPLEAKTTVENVTPEMAEAYLELPRGCSWKGCKASYQSKMPKGWRCIGIYTEDILDGEIDGVLCPKHVLELTNNLVMGFRLSVAITEESRSDN